ncbi:MAG: hypothetical protein ACLP3K_11850 [Candidatus Acidiferrales bacterium]
MSENDLLEVIVIVLVAILWTLQSISRRLKERFPTEKESDLQWAKDDPMGHFEAHKADKTTKASK